MTPYQFMPVRIRSLPPGIRSSRPAWDSSSTWLRRTGYEWLPSPILVQGSRPGRP